MASSLRGSKVEEHAVQQSLGRTYLPSISSWEVLEAQLLYTATSLMFVGKRLV